MTPRRLYVAGWALALLLGAALALTVYRYHLKTQALFNAALAEGQGRARFTARKVGEKLAELERLAHGVVADLNSGRMTPADAPGRLGGILEQAPPSTVRLGVLFQPYAAGNGLRRFGPTAVRHGGTVRTIQYERLLDYTHEPWYRLDSDRGLWGDSHLALDHSTLLVDYVEGFRLPGAEAPSGVVRVAVALNGIQEMMDELSLDFPGYAFLMSGKTAFLASSRPEMVRSGKTLVQLAEDLQDPVRRRLAQCALEGRPGWGESTSGATGQKTLSFLEPIPSAGWTAGVNMFEGDLALVPPDRPGAVLRMVTLAVALAWVLAFLAFKGPRLTPLGLWWTVGTGSLMMVAGIAALFYFRYTSPPARRTEEFRVTDAPSLERFKAQHGTLKQGVEAVKPDYVPTGVFVQTLEVSGPSQVRMTGTIWQKLPRNTPRAERGVALPESLAGEVAMGNEKTEGDFLIQYYTFKATVAPELDESKFYPFDRIRARLRLWPKAIYGNQVLVPDLGSYPILSFGSFPGLDRAVDVPGWLEEGSEFAYVLTDYSTRFGTGGFSRQRQSPELVYNVQLKRAFLGPLIVAFLPLLAVAGLLFTVVLTISQDPVRIKGTGYGFMNLLRTAIGLFFSLVVAQFNIRSRIVAGGVLYLEWYYFLLYGAILVVAFDALRAAAQDAPLRHGDNLIRRLAFWPALLGCFYAISSRFAL